MSTSSPKKDANRIMLEDLKRQFDKLSKDVIKQLKEQRQMIEKTRIELMNKVLEFKGLAPNTGESIMNNIQLKVK